MYWVTRAVGRRYSNHALLASAWHHRSDAFSSVVAAVQEKLCRVIGAIPGVLSYHSFRARHAGAGGMIEMDVHVEVDPELTVRAGNDVASRVEVGIRRELPDVIGIVIHIEPAKGRPAADRAG
jgi:divalent metal cation (Fe/Co/Zn/Cd) transporter